MKNRRTSRRHPSTHARVLTLMLLFSASSLALELNLIAARPTTPLLRAQVTTCGTCHWNGANSADWSDTSNWDEAGTPTTASVVIIPDTSGGSGRNPTMTAVTVSLHSVSIAAKAALTMSGSDVDITSGSLTVSGSLIVGGDTASSTLSIVGSSVAVFPQGTCDLHRGVVTVSNAGSVINSGSLLVGTKGNMTFETQTTFRNASTGMLTNSGALELKFTTSNFANDGAAYVSGTGTIVYQDATGFLFGSDYHNLIVDGDSTVDRTINVSGTTLLWDAGTVLRLGGHTVTFSQTLQNPGTIVTSGGETLTLTNDVSQGTWQIDGGQLPAQNYYNLTLNTDTSLPAAMSVAGSLTIGNGKTLKTYGHDLSVGGTVTNNGTIVSSGTERYTLTNDTTNGTWTVTGAVVPLTSFHHLDVAANAAFSGATVTIGGTLTIEPGIALTASASNLTVSGDWINNGTFNPSHATVTFAGVATQTLSGSTTFNNFTRIVSSGNGELDFRAGSTQTVTGALVMHGAVGGHILTLRSTTPSSAWLLDAQGSKTISYLDVQDSTAVTPIDCTGLHCTDSARNTGWTFSSPGPSPYATTTDLVRSAGVSPSTLGDVITFKATIMSGATVATDATLTVQFKDGQTPIGAPVTISNGSGSYMTGALIVGAHPIHAVYSGDANFLSSTGTLVQVVNAVVASSSSSSVATGGGGGGGGGGGWRSPQNNWRPSTISEVNLLSEPISPLSVAPQFVSQPTTSAAAALRESSDSYAQVLSTLQYAHISPTSPMSGVAAYAMLASAASNAGVHPSAPAATPTYGTLSRSAATHMLLDTFGIPVPQIPSYNPNLVAVAVAWQYGIVRGNSTTGELMPDDPVTPAQLVVMIARTKSLLGTR